VRPAPLSIGYLHVVSADEVYAATYPGEIFEGSQYGWHELTEAAGGVRGIVKWKDAIIVLTPRAGMFKLERNRLVPFKAQLEGELIHAGQTLMWVNGGGILETTDFSTFGRLLGSEIGKVVDARFYPG